MAWWKAPIILHVTQLNHGKNDLEKGSYFEHETTLTLASNFNVSVPSLLMLMLSKCKE